MADNQKDNLHVQQAIAGMNMETTGSQRSVSELSYVNNGVVQGFDGNSLYIQAEQSNELCVTFPKGMHFIGGRNILEKNQVLYLLTNPETGDSEIGYSTYEDCNYYTLIADKNNDQKLGFDIRFPIRKIHIKSTNCSTQAFWTDGKNPRRYLDFDNLPWKEIPDPKNDYKKIKLVGQLDVNVMNVQPNYSCPIIKVEKENTGGRLKMGTYQFAAQYGNSLGDGYTSYFSITNPAGIFENIIGADPDVTTNKSLSIDISNLDTSGLWDYFNIAVVKTINGISTAYLVGTFPITNSNFKYTYTGTDTTEIQLTLEEIFEQFPYYNRAGGSFDIDGIVGWYELSYDEEINFQQIANKIPVGWETWKIPYNQFEGYNSAQNTANIKGGMRDEVYPLELYLTFTNGQRTRSFHIPGRIANNNDLAPVSNNDSDSVNINPCDVPEIKKRWQVYNTGSLTDFSKEWTKGSQDNCYVGPYQYGENAYWESEELYPNNELIWGELANTPIRHHKLPDSVITHIHDNVPFGEDPRTYEHSIYPIGFKIPDGAVEEAINNSSLSAAQKAQIAGWGIARGNRAGGNKSIIAKGIFNNVGEYTFQQTPTDDIQTYLYPNYPYNDLRKDPFFTTKKLHSHSGYVPGLALEGFSDGSKSRFTFHSPDTHFSKSPGINTGYLKLETIEYGNSFGHFQKVRKNAEYKFLSKETFKAAAGIAAASGLNLGAGTFGSPTISLAPVPATFQAARDLFEKLVPYTNFGYTHHSTGWYGNAFVVPNEGDKIRTIEYGQYITDGKNNVEQAKLLNNYRRESSIYLNTRTSLLFPTEYDASIPEDTSRYSLSSIGNNSYSIDDFFSEFLTTTGHNITSEDISEEIVAYSTIPGGDDQTGNKATFKGTVSTADKPENGDIYHTHGTNYVITSVTVNPTSTTTSQYTITATIISYDPTTFVDPTQSGSLTLYYAISGSSSTSSSLLSYNFSEITAATNVNNYFTETTVRNDIATFVAGTPTIVNYYNLLEGTERDRLLYFVIFNSYQRVLGEKGIFNSPDSIRKTNISSYYGSIKAYLPSQWGRMYSYETIDTGYRQLLGQPTGTIFGGDCFINRFALKTKTSIFVDTTFGDGDGTDIEYDQLGNYGWPMYWLSTRAEDLKIDVQKEIDGVVKILENSPFIDGDGSTLGKIWTAIKGILTGGFANSIPVLKLLLKIFKEIARTIGVNNINFDNYKLDGIMETGLYYMYVYGIPYYFVESEVNVDYRQAKNQTDGNFYPNVGGGIPDDWLQEVNTSILHDNTYTYNNTYSKQNKESLFTHLREDYDPTKPCFYTYPNRAIWAEQSNVEETKNHWLVYRPTARFDLPKSYGPICSLDGIENRQILARFQNRTQIHNALTTIDTNNGPNAYLATPKLFSTQPIDLSATDNGEGGSQHVLLLRTPFGHVYTDAKRGAIYMLNGNQPTDLTQKGMDKWFKHFLPFFVLKVNTEVPIDNTYNNIGITGVYDGLYKRIIITKKDYEPLVKGIDYNENGEFIFNNNVISVEDNNYFCDRSWTLSYSFVTQSWTSFHSYQPKYYIEHAKYFQSGITHLWNHNTDYTSYHNFYGTLYPYIIEYNVNYQFNDEILQNIKDHTVALRYTDYETYTEPDKTLYFNKAILYNNQQCTGILNLVPKTGLAGYGKYPIYNSDSKDIQVTKTDNFFNFNTFWNITKDPNVPIWNKTCSFKYTNKLLNFENLDFTNKSYKKAPLRAKNCSIRLIEDIDSGVRLISRFILSETKDSFL